MIELSLIQSPKTPFSAFDCLFLRARNRGLTRQKRKVNTKDSNVQWVVVIRTAREIYAGMEPLVFTLWKSLHLMELIEPPAVPTSPAGPAYEDLGPTPAPETVRTGQSGSKPKCLKAEEKPTSLFAP